MAGTKTVIEQAYSAFNRRDIDGALALMTEDVSWPKASEGGKVVGKEAIRAYWARRDECPTSSSYGKPERRVESFRAQSLHYVDAGGACRREHRSDYRRA